MIELTREQKFIILGLIALLISGLFYGAYNYYFKPLESEVFISNNESLRHSSGQASPGSFLLVHLSGAVKREGVYKIKTGSRRLDVIKAAGGFSSKADLSKVNLAKEVNDGEKIIIPFKKINILIEKNETFGGSVGGLIGINSANQNRLQEIPGVGKVTAERIIEYRSSNGGFSSVDDLKKVKGVGEKKFEKIKDFVTLN